MGKTIKLTEKDFRHFIAESVKKTINEMNGFSKTRSIPSGKHMNESKKVIKLNESHLRNIVKESVKMVLNERSYKNTAFGGIYFNDCDSIADQLESNGTLDEESASRLYSDLEDIFGNIEIKGVFNTWYYPQSYWEPEDSGCEFVGIQNEDEIFKAIQNLQWPDQIKNFVKDYFNDWVEKHSDGDGWDLWLPEDDRDDDRYDD